MKASRRSGRVEHTREALAEFFGTFVLILFGVGVVAQVALGGGATASTCRSIWAGASP